MTYFCTKANSPVFLSLALALEFAKESHKLWLLM